MISNLKGHETCEKTYGHREISMQETEIRNIGTINEEIRPNMLLELGEISRTQEMNSLMT